MPSNKPTDEGLSESQQQLLASDIIGDALDLTTAVPHPTAVLLGGQPGAGKSAVKGQVVARFADNGGIVAVDPDEIRLALPYMDAYLAKGGSAIPDYANKDAGTVAYMVLQGVAAAQRNVLNDGTLRNTELAKNMALDLTSAGFNVEFHGMAVYPDLSHARTYLRREEEIRRSPTGFGRAVDDGFHHAAVEGYTSTVKAFYADKRVARMVLYDRAGAVATDVKLEAGEWRVSGLDAVPAEKHPMNVLHKAHTQPDAATLYEAAVTWSEATQLASTRTPMAPDVDKLAQHQAEAEAKARLAVTSPVPSKSYRGKIVAIEDTEVLQAVGGAIISHRKAGLIGPHKASLLDVGADVKITYGTHLDQALIQPGSRTHSHRR